MSLSKYKPLKKGKVRNVYSVPDRDDLLCIMTTDAVSVFDEVIGKIPNRGIALNKISNYWKDQVEKAFIIKTDHFSGNHKHCAELLGIKNSKHYIGRLNLVRKAEALPVECIVRGYMAGSLWSDYQEKSCEGGIYLDNPLPGGLLESERLPEPIFTPTTKAEEGHDLPLTFHDMVVILEDWMEEKSISFEETNYANAEILSEKIVSVSLEIYSMAHRLMMEKGIIIADTKFEFGFVKNESRGGFELCLIDEVLTPDSSRFWLKDEYSPGQPQKSLDKQVLRDWARNNKGKEIPEYLQVSLYELYLSIYDIVCK